MDWLHFSVVRLGKKWPHSSQGLLVLPDTARLILGYFKNNSYISKLTFMQNNHNFMFSIFILSLL